MIDKQGRIFGKISVVDIFIVAIIAAVVAVVYFNVGAGGRPAVAGPARPVYVTFFHPALEDFTVNAIALNVPVINDSTGSFMGTVVGVERGDSINFLPDVHGNEIASPMEGYSSVSITSRVYAHLTNGAAVIEGNIYGVGTEIIIWAGKAKTHLQIAEIN